MPWHRQDWTPSTRFPSDSRSNTINLSIIVLFTRWQSEIEIENESNLRSEIGLSTHATMMFENMPASSFNPMRDVLFPLDLSNPASFNAIMAHAAAHLAHQYGGTTPNCGKNSWEALKFKADAVNILTQWVNDPKMALSNDAFAAVVRLLTFEVNLQYPLYVPLSEKHYS